MRGAILAAALCAAAACSRAPSPDKAYAEAWDPFRQGKLERAQNIADSGLKGSESSGTEALRLLQIEILLARGRARSAEALLSKLPDPPDLLLHLRWLVDRADAASKLDRSAEAFDCLDEVDRTAGSYAASDPVLRGRLLRGAMLARQHSFEEADRVLLETATRAAGVGDAFNQAGALLNLSYSTFSQTRYDESVNYGRSALEVAERVHAGRLAGLANNNLGLAYTVLHVLDRAEAHLNTAIGQLREIGDLRNLERALGNRGNVRLQSRNPQAAVQDFRDAAEIATSIEAISDASRWAGQLSLAFTDQQNWAEAESWNQQAVALNAKLQEPENRLYLKLNAAVIANGKGNRAEAIRLYRELIAEAGMIPYLEWNAHVRLGSLLASETPLEANVEYERGLKVLEEVRSSLIQDDHRLTYQDALMQFFKDYVELLVSEGREQQALQVAESSRARLLSEKLGFKNGSRELQAADFQRYASREGEALLSYWLAPKRSFVWAVTSRGIHMKMLPGQDEIEKLVQAYKKAIEDELRDPLDSQMPQAERLGEVLLGPVQTELAGARRVVIVPDRALHGLNFETLPAPKSHHYWIEDVELSLAPSLSLIAGTPPRPRSKPSLLVLGAPVAAGPEYPELPAATPEIEGIRRRFAGRDQVIRIGPDATPQAFLDAMPGRFSMIHFAAHAETNSQTPLESAIILSNSGGRFKLYARDITGLKLSADLVTISACRSAGARAYGGEGLVGFAWAFLQSGARSVIAGLWDVGDNSSSRLIQSLYDALASGSQPAAALRQAKLELLHSSGSYRKPYYWAPYQTYIR